MSALGQAEWDTWLPLAGKRNWHPGPRVGYSQKARQALCCPRPALGTSVVNKEEMDSECGLEAAAGHTVSSVS
jgi:hypothetical protein